MLSIYKKISKRVQYLIGWTLIILVPFLPFLTQKVNVSDKAIFSSDKNQIEQKSDSYLVYVSTKTINQDNSKADQSNYRSIVIRTGSGDLFVPFNNNKPVDLSTLLVNNDNHHLETFEEEIKEHFKSPYTHCFKNVRYGQQKNLCDIYYNPVTGRIIITKSGTFNIISIEYD